MRLSLVFELLIIFILLAFAASRVIDSPSLVERKVPRQGPPNRYCACTNLMCNCCREFSLAVVPIKGPGCATLTYLQGDSLVVTMSFGDRVLHNTTITDYEGFSVFGDDFLGGLFGESSKKKKNTNVNKPQPVFQPLSVSSERPILDPTPRPAKPATKPTVRPVRVRTTVRPVRVTRTTTRKPPQRFTRPTTSTTTPKPVTKVPQLLTTINVQEEPGTSTPITIPVTQGDETETVSPDVSSGVTAVVEDEKSETTTTKESQTTPVMEIATEITRQLNTAHNSSFENMLCCLPVLLLLHLCTAMNGHQGSLSQLQANSKDLITEVRMSLTWLIFLHSKQRPAFIYLKLRAH
ncbi:hypothetical protein Cfor_08894 [Coptotermes formosanus]|uniref:DUF4773 domain-containing protein n=1 Tax=Coptotermes formosanus TaxID=36987 RepID=A0A6L2P8C9_COPFO|nr:hypothetical protein Cfor_08894 [Coptotermes formosanus]